jgi:Mg-chelatase subunit ChlD
MSANANENFLCPITQSVMEDPVIGSDGITYERTAIEAWFASGKQISPMTRQPMTSRSLVPNYALKAMIADARKAATAPTAAPAPAVVLPAPAAVSIHTSRDGDTYHISLSADGPTLPTLFIDVLDVSGSMGNPSVDSTQAGSDAAAFSRADLVRHSVATQIELLRPQDELAVVLFDNNAAVALEPTRMSPAGKTTAKAVLPLIRPCGGTNIWLGLQKALTVAASVDTSNKNVVIILQTDGESDPSYNPPRGIVDTFRAWLDSRPAVRTTVHTVGYGFGSALDMPLLRKLAAAGGGTVNYIPDGSMVGTVFIHLMANLMAATHRGLHLQIPEIGFSEPVGFLQAGQTRDFIVTTHDPSFTVAVADKAGPVASLDVKRRSAPKASPTDIAFHQFRTNFLDKVSEMLDAAETADVTPRISELMALLSPASRDPRVQAIQNDIYHSDPGKGQISKALSPQAAFQRWGRHYLPGVICGHKNQWAINFRDEGSTIYGSAVTRELIAKGEDLFNSLPPPTASCASATSRSAAAAASSYSMAYINSSAGSCFLGGSRFAMAGGWAKRCDQIRPGDTLANGARVRCVIKTDSDYVDVVRLGSQTEESGGGITLWHPVRINGAWVHPATIGQVIRVRAPAIYNFVLDSQHTVMMDGVEACTLAHDFTGDAVIEHAYFGKRVPGRHNILDDLEGAPGWSEGYIHRSNLQVDYDPVTGHIRGVTATYHGPHAPPSDVA